MTAITPVAPGRDLPVKVWAKNQPEYSPLPCYSHRDPEGTITIRWKLTWPERIAILLRGSIWQQVLTFGNRLQPIRLTAYCPNLRDNEEAIVDPDR